MTHVLIVEDEPLVALDIQTVLEDAGLEVAGIAATVEQACEMVGAADLHAAVLDGNLQGESAASVASALREEGIPFLVVSGYLRSQLSDWLGDAPLIRKPYLPHQLVAEIRRLAGHDAG